MARRNDSWGIEVGANALKAIRLVRSGKNVEVVDWAILPFKQVLTTPDLNVDEAIQVNLDAFLAKHDTTKSHVVISVPGHLAFARFAKLPPVEPKKIPDIVRFEAVQQIPFPIDQVEWDYQVFQQQDSPDVEVGIFAITKERVMNFLSNYRQLNVRVDALTLSPLAVYNAFAYENVDEPDQSGTIYMDIGTQSTDVIIVEDGGIWLRTLPIGGNNFTDALVKAFKLSFSKAEKLKKEAGTSKYARQIFQAMRPVFADLVQEMQRSLGYYQSMNRDAELNRLVGVGSTFKLPGLQKFLKQQLQMEVVRPDGFKRISVEGKQQSEFSEHALNFATAYGLALQGVGLEQVSANVLPQHIMRQRLWKSKQPWIAAAAACIAVASGLAGGRYFMASAEWSAAEQQIQQTARPVVNRAQGYVNEWNETAQGSDPRMRIENLRRILDYRDLWPKLMEDLAMAAAAMGPQAETLQADYSALQRLPLNQRRRFYIDSFRAEYRVGQAEVQNQAGGGGGAGATGTDAMAMLTGQHTISTFFGSGIEPPRFVVTVTGSTPHADAVGLVSREFVGFLNRARERNNRPYIIQVEGNPIIRQFRVQEATTTGRSDMMMGGGRTPFQPPGNRAGRAAPPPGGGGIFAPGQQQQQQQDQPLLPVRGTTDTAVGSTGFEIRWTVKLVEPERARRAEERRPGGPREQAPREAAPSPETIEPPPSAADPTTPPVSPAATRDEAAAVVAADQEVSS
jgi:type IV pilus assembly protein PilM